jgi:hypothetical protein
VRDPLGVAPGRADVRDRCERLQVGIHRADAQVCFEASLCERIRIDDAQGRLTWCNRKWMDTLGLKEA